MSTPRLNPIETQDADSAIRAAIFSPAGSGGSPTDASPKAAPQLSIALTLLDTKSTRRRPSKVRNSPPCLPPLTFICLLTTPTHNLQGVEAASGVEQIREAARSIALLQLKG